MLQFLSGPEIFFLILFSAFTIHMANQYLTPSCLKIFLPRVDNFENNFYINHTSIKRMKESCGLDFVQHFSFKYLLKIPFKIVRRFWALYRFTIPGMPDCLYFLKKNSKIFEGELLFGF